MLATYSYIQNYGKRIITSVSYTNFMLGTNQASGASNQLSEAFQVEEMFKQAAGEIMCWVSS